MNLKAVIPLVGAVGLGLVAAALVKNSMAKRNVAAGPTNLVPVVVAKVDIEPGHELTAEDLTVNKVPTEAAQGAVFSDPTKLTGRMTIAGLGHGQPLTETMLTPSGAGTGLQALIPPGMRAMTIEINEISGVAGMLSPGCRVDIIGAIRSDKAGGSVSRIVLQNLKVQALGQRMGPPAPAAPGQPPPPPSNNVTLLVTPKQAQTLQLACVMSRPWLVLRSLRDGREVNSEPTTLAELLGDSNDINGGATAVAQTTPPPVNAPVEKPVVAPESDPFAEAPTTKPVVADVRRTVKILRGGSESEVSFIIPAVQQAQADSDDNGHQDATTGADASPVIK